MVAEPFQAFNRWGFWNVELGYRFRNRAPSDEIRFDSSVGYNFTQDWMLLQQFFTITSAGNADSVELTELEGNPSVFPEFDMYKAKLSLARDVSPNVTLHAGVSHTFAGTNIGGGPSFVLGFWSNF